MGFERKELCWPADFEIGMPYICLAVESVGRRYGASPSDIDDLQQEVLMVIWQKRHDTSFPNTAALYGYAYKAAWTLWRSQKKKQQNVAASDPELVESAPLALAGNLPCTASEITKAIYALPEPYREIATLRFLRGYKYKALVQKLGIALGTVYKRLLIARKLLQRRLLD